MRRGEMLCLAVAEELRREIGRETTIYGLINAQCAVHTTY